jgi:hypothetical protein
MNVVQLVKSNYINKLEKLEFFFNEHIYIYIYKIDFYHHEKQKTLS